MATNCHDIKLMEYSDIKEKRTKYKISQTKLAEATGYSKAQISSWELMKTFPNDSQLQVLSNTLGKLIFDIESKINDVRKKRITRTDTAKKKLPKVIKSKADYENLYHKINRPLHNSYKEKLTDLYNRSQRAQVTGAPTAIALFSGCGGLSLGFAAEGFDLVGHIEIEESANKIYEDNFKGSDLLGTDICKITDDEIDSWKNKYGDIDVIIGGPPCQGFSLAGKRNPNDIRNELYTYYVHIVSKVKPKVFVMENVRLLTSMKTSEGTLFIDDIVSAFGKEGYVVYRNEINAADYGVPQSRERVILIGVREDINRPFSFPNSTSILSDGRLSFRDATFDLDTLESGEVSSDPLHWSITHPEHVITWLKDVPEGMSAHDNENPELRPPSGFNTTYKRIKWNEPCSTISTNFSMISGCRNVHPTSTRSLTIREATRVQSFPDEFIFEGNWGAIRKAIGNAVPPLLAQIIAKAIKTQYFKNEK